MIAQLDLFQAPEPRQLSGCVTEPWHMWTRFQNGFRRLERRAQASHGRVNDIRAKKTAILHAALRGGVQ